MPVDHVWARADLENVASVELPQDYTFYLDVRRPNTSEERKGVTCNRLSEDDIPNSRGKAHLIIKFGGVTGTLNIVDVKGLTVGKLTAEDEKPAALASFECRGLEVVRFHPGSGFRVTSEDGTVFENVDLSDAEGWSDYCEKGKKPVSIVNFSTTIGSRP